MPPTATSLQDLYLNKLRMVYDAEQQALQAMPQMLKMAKTPELKQGFERHQRETEQQVQRLEQIFQSQAQQAQPLECKPLRAMVEEAQEVAAAIQDADTLDAFLVSGAQAIEHHEIAEYGTLRSWALQLGREDDARLLQQTLDEEGNADKLLTKVAEGFVNRRAAKGGERQVAQGAVRESGAGAGGSGGGRSTSTGAGDEASRR